MVRICATSSPGSRESAPTAPSWSAAMPRNRVPTRTGCRSCARWRGSATPSRTSVPPRLCLDRGAIATGRAARRAEGLALPVHIGLPGVAEPHRLLAISARIGVVGTHRFLVKNTRFVARLPRPGGFYRPDGLLEGLAPLIADPAAGVADLHVYTFNAVEVTEAWRRRYLAALGAALPA